MLTLEREKPSASPTSSAFSGLADTYKQRVNLAHRAVDAPAAAHFAKVQHEALREGR